MIPLREIQTHSDDSRWQFLSLAGSIAISLLILLAISLAKKTHVEESLPETITAIVASAPPPPPPPPLKKPPPDLPRPPPLELSSSRGSTSITAWPDLQVAATKPEVSLDWARASTSYRPTLEWSADHVFDLEEVDQGPVVIYRKIPEMSPRLLESLKLDSFTIIYIINKEGRAEKPYVLNSSSKEFNEAIRAAIREWRFRPAIKGGEPANTMVQQKIITSKRSSSPFER